jgi:hypothetical protein
MKSKYDSGKIPESGINIKTKDTIKKQSIPNLKKGSSLQNYKRVETLGRILKDFEFPDKKDKVLKFIKNKIDDKELINKLEKIEDKEYLNISQVSYEAGLVY